MQNAGISIKFYYTICILNIKKYILKEFNKVYKLLHNKLNLATAIKLLSMTSMNFCIWFPVKWEGGFDSDAALEPLNYGVTTLGTDTLNIWIRKACDKSSVV